MSKTREQQIELRDLRDRVAYLEKKLESKNKMVAQFCHATSNTLQPDILRKVIGTMKETDEKNAEIHNLSAAVLVEAADEIEVYRNICLGLFEIFDDLGYDVGDVKEHLPS